MTFEVFGVVCLLAGKKKKVGGPPTDKYRNSLVYQLKAEKARSRIISPVCLFHYYRIFPPAEIIIAVKLSSWIARATRIISEAS